MSIDAVYHLLPELVLVAVASLVYVAGAFTATRRLWTWLALGGLLVAALALGEQSWAASGEPGRLAGPKVQALLPLAADLMANYVRWLALGVGAAFVLLCFGLSGEVEEPEYVGTLLLAVAGLMLVAAARELVLVFLGLELISIPTYVLLYLGRRDLASQEAAAKYFFLSILSSAVTLYGFSFLYGAGRSTDLAAIQSALAAEAAYPTGLRPLAAVALVLIFAGLGFKIAAVPFHFYAPDVYQGTTNANAGVLAVVPKIAGFVALVRIVAVAMPGLEAFGWGVSLVLAVLTMTLGNVLALWQDHVRRLLAYSSIAHAGYMLIGLAVGFAADPGAPGSAPLRDGVGAMLFYLAVYAVATTGTFAALAYLGAKGRQIDGVDELSGLSRTHPLTAAALAVFMFSLAGAPPLAGFWGKFLLFSGALDLYVAGGAAGRLGLWFLALAIIGVLNAAIAAAYYLRIVAVMYFRAPVSVPRAEGGWGAAAAAAFALVAVVGVGLHPGPLVTRSNDASQSARGACNLSRELAQ